MFEFKEVKENVALVKPDFNIEIDKLDYVLEMKNKILDWIKDIDNPSVILDLENCDYIDSTGLGNIIRIFEQLRRKKGKLYAFNIKEDVRSLFELTTLDNLIECRDSLSDIL